MTYYSYDAQTGEFEFSGEAHENPMSPGEYLLPGHATFTAPPESQPGKALVWTGEAWELKDDLRGRKYWHKETKEPLEVKAIGEVPGGDWTEKEPTDHEAIWNGAEWEVPFEVLRARKISQIRAEADAELRQIQAGYSQSEIISWIKQEAGARELTANPDATTPDAEFVRSLATARGVDTACLVEKIMGNLNPYAETMAAVLGNQQRREDLVKLADTPEELEEI